MSPSADVILVVSNNREGGQDVSEKKLRESTDGYYFLVHILFLCGLSGLLAYCFLMGDLMRLRNGYDNCKNICGGPNVLNDADKTVDCEHLDMKQRPYLVTFKPDGRNSYNATYTGHVKIDMGVIERLSNDTARVCVVNCDAYPNFEPLRNRCILKKRKGVTDRFYGKSGIPNLFVEVGEDLTLCWTKFLYLGIGASVLSFMIIIFLAFFTWAMIWLVLNAAVLLCAALTIYMWFLLVKTKLDMDVSEKPAELDLERFRSYLAFALHGTFITPLLVSIMLTNRRRMETVVQLYKETSKAIAALPFLFLQPILTCIFVSATISGWIYATLWVESAGIVKRPKLQYFFYAKDGWMVAARWCNIFASLWLIQFFLDCQHMVTAGAVSFWYFCRNKNDLGIPVIYGFYHLLRYHLGSVSLGSLLTLLVAIPRRVLVLTQTYFKEKEEEVSAKCCLGWSRWRENILKYFIRDAYIEVVIYGYPFRSAGRQAFRALTTNDVDIITIKGIGNFVLLFVKILVSAATVLAGAIILQEYEDLLHIWVILILIGIFAYLISTCFFSLYQSIIDTIFVCFCEDKEHHDGHSQPYFTSKEFFQFIDNSRKFCMGSCKEEIKTNI